MPTELTTFERVKQEVFSLLTQIRRRIRYSEESTKNIEFVIDEDDMRSNLDTKVPTQQSVKSYVDNLSIDFTHTFLLMGA